MGNQGVTRGAFAGRFGRQRAGRVATTTAVLAAVAAVALGTGYTASRTFLADGGAYMGHGHTVVHANAATGTVDATVNGDLVGQPGDQHVVQTSTGVTVVIDTTANTVTSIDPMTMTPGPTTTPTTHTADLDFVAVGELGYVIDSGAKQVQPVDPRTMTPAGAAIRVDGHIGGAVVSGDSAWVLDDDAGTVIQITGTTGLVPLQVAAAGHDLQLTAVSGDPVVVDATSGWVRRIKAADASLDEPIEVDGTKGHRLAPNDPSADGTKAWLLVQDTGELVGVDLDSSRVTRGQLGERAKGAPGPLVVGDRVYVTHDHQVHAYDANSLSKVDTYSPDGKSDRLEVFVKDGNVWINDPKARNALVVGPDGTAKTIDKGSGKGVEEEKKDETAAPPPPDQPEPEPEPQPEPELPPAPEPTVPPPPPEVTEPELPVVTEPPPTVPPVVVPNVVGKMKAAACDEIRALGLECIDIPTRTGVAKGVKRDEVVAQFPQAGQELMPNDPQSRVEVTFYSPDPVPVPPVVGEATLGPEQETAACRKTRDAGLECKLVDKGVAPTTPQVVKAGQATAQNPPASASQQLPAKPDWVDPGTVVTVDFYSSATVPDFVSTPTTYADAKAALEARGLVYAGQDKGECDPVNQVTNQQYPASTPLAAQTSVVIEYCGAPYPVIPDFRVGGNQNAIDACASIQATFPCTAVNAAGPAPGPWTPGAVHSQSAVGSAPRGTRVELVYEAPDRVVHRWMAINLPARAPEPLWALSGPGLVDHGPLQTRTDAWQYEGPLFSCYSYPAAGTVPLKSYQRITDDDPRHEDHWYGFGSPGYDYVPHGLGGGADDTFGCYVYNWQATTTQVFDYNAGPSHYWTTTNGDNKGWGLLSTFWARPP